MSVLLYCDITTCLRHSTEGDLFYCALTTTLRGAVRAIFKLQKTLLWLQSLLQDKGKYKLCARFRKCGVSDDECFASYDKCCLHAMMLVGQVMTSDVCKL